MNLNPACSIRCKSLADGTVSLSGNTFPYKEQIKALGGKWNPETKTWVIPAETDLSSLQPPPPPDKMTLYPFLCCKQAKVLDRIEEAFLCKTHNRFPWWMCCADATIVDVGRQTCSCERHGDPMQGSLRVRGSLYTGT